MTLQFIDGGGAMGALIRNHSWAETPLGPPTQWPAPLRTIVSIMLNAPQPMFAVWRPEQWMFYNDSYAEILGGAPPCTGATFSGGLE